MNCNLADTYFCVHSVIVQLLESTLNTPSITKSKVKGSKTEEKNAKKEDNLLRLNGNDVERKKKTTKSRHQTILKKRRKKNAHTRDRIQRTKQNEI